MTIEIMDKIYSGKAKDVYKTSKDDVVMVKFRDDITAGDGDKKDNLELKGYYNSIISSKLFEILEKNDIKTQYIELKKPGEIISQKLKMIPLEVITRNIATGSLVKKFPFTDKEELKKPIIQMDYKNDEYHDPMLNEDIILALDIATKEELDEIRAISLKVNDTLKDFLEKCGIILVDYKIELGKNSDGNIVVGDEISPDTCRFWDKDTYDILDKDLFRKGESGVISAYKEVTDRILDLDDKKRWKIK